MVVEWSFTFTGQRSCGGLVHDVDAYVVASFYGDFYAIVIRIVKPCFTNKKKKSRKYLKSVCDVGSNRALSKGVVKTQFFSFFL